MRLDWGPGSRVVSLSSIQVLHLSDEKSFVVDRDPHSRAIVPAVCLYQSDTSMCVELAVSIADPQQTNSPQRSYRS